MEAGFEQAALSDIQIYNDVPVIFTTEKSGIHTLTAVKASLLCGARVANDSRFFGAPLIDRRAVPLLLKNIKKVIRNKVIKEAKPMDISKYASNVDKLGEK